MSEDNIHKILSNIFDRYNITVYTILLHIEDKIYRSYRSLYHPNSESFSYIDFNDHSSLEKQLIKDSVFLDGQYFFLSDDRKDIRDTQETQKMQIIRLSLGKTNFIFCVVNEEIKFSDDEITILNLSINSLCTKENPYLKNKDLFIANMSHELRTPLNGVVGYSQLLYSTNPSDDQKKYLSCISKCCVTLLKVVNDILDYSKLSSGKMPLSEKSTKIKDTINSVEKMIKFSLIEKKHSLDIKIDPNIPNILTIDESKLIQILINLLSNAIKYTDKEGKISLSVKSDSDNLYFEVRDNGNGIPKDKQKSIFSTFFTARIGGTGLGLSISRMLCRLLGGELNFVSEEGKGSLFFFAVKYKKYTEPNIVCPNNMRFALIISKDDKLRIYLSSLLIRFGVISIFEYNSIQPDYIFSDTKDLLDNKKDSVLIFVSSDDIESFLFDHVLTYKDGTIDMEHLKDILSSTKKRSLRIDKNISILIAEDDTSNRELLENILRSLKFINIITAEDGLDCIRKIKNTKIDLLFLDLVMPKLSGYQVLDYLRTIKHPVKIVPVSASVLEEDQKKCREYGLEFFVKKPIEISYLKDVLISILA